MDMTHLRKPDDPRIAHSLRFFISSTFQDMQEEREELIKRVFPAIRKMCEQRGVTCHEVDLRWGIPKEWWGQGEMLSICITEAEKCHPFFVGLLGERYGSIPDEIPPELVQGRPWLAEHRGRSVTELEILAGALQMPSTPRGTFFYFRNASCVSSPCPELHSEPGKEVDPEEGLRLADLKKRIRESKLPVREYQSLESLTEMIRKDLKELIEELFPASSRPDPLEQESWEQEVFALSRFQNYIPREEDFERLATHVRGDGLPLVILGEPGVGKSALLVNWAKRCRDMWPDLPFWMHSIGTSPASADLERMLRRLVGEIQRLLGLRQEIPVRPEALSETFSSLLNRVAARGRLVLVLDGLDRLEDRGGSLDLAWLPENLPAGVRLIVSAAAGPSLEILKRRAWPSLTVKPLRPHEREELIRRYLGSYSKDHDRARTKLIAENDRLASPLFLRTVLEELRVHGKAESLEERIRDCLDAADLPDLYRKILDRYERDYERGRPGLVRDAFSLLWAARRGLSEAELLDLLGSPEGPLPQAIWSPLWLAVEAWLINRSGWMSFTHGSLRQAVESRYLPTQEEQRQAHLRLADYFQDRAGSPRRAEELSWQLERAEDWKRLHGALTNPDIFEELWDARMYDVIHAWRLLEKRSEFRVAAAFVEMLRSQRYGRGALFKMAELILSRGEYQIATVAFGGLAEIFRDRGDPANQQAALGNQGIALFHLGALEEALIKFREQERIARESEHEIGCMRALLGQFGVLYRQRKSSEAQALLAEIERRVSLTEDPELRAELLGARALLLADLGQLEDAKEHLHQQQRLARMQDHKGLILASLTNLLVLAEELLPESSLSHHATDLALLSRELGDRRGQMISSSIQARLAIQRLDWSTALDLLQEQEILARSQGETNQLAFALISQAALLVEKFNQLDQALPPAREALRLAESLDAKTRTGIREIFAGLCRLQANASIPGNEGKLSASAETRLLTELVARVEEEDQGESLLSLSEAFEALSRLLGADGRLTTSEQIRLCRRMIDRLSSIPRVGELRAMFMTLLARALAAEGRCLEAVAAGRPAEEWLASSPPLASWHARCLCDLGRALVASGKREEGTSCLERAVGALAHSPDTESEAAALRQEIQTLHAARKRPFLLRLLGLR
jgi:tetratricopeptide (TPR) repeat protein